MDAVNLTQLKDAGMTVDTDGTVTNAFVAYDKGTMDSVTLQGGTNGTTIHRVAAGVKRARRGKHQAVDGCGLRH